MSTELYDAKDIADDIHEIAEVPPGLNDPIIYSMTIGHIEELIKDMDRRHLPMAEQRRLMGIKKDYLIDELISLRVRGVLRSGDEGQRMAPPRVVKPSQIQVKRMH